MYLRLESTSAHHKKDIPKGVSFLCYVRGVAANPVLTVVRARRRELLNLCHSQSLSPTTLWRSQSSTSAHRESSQICLKQKQNNFGCFYAFNRHCMHFPHKNSIVRLSQIRTWGWGFFIFSSKKVMQKILNAVDLNNKKAVL